MNANKRTHICATECILKLGKNSDIVYVSVY